MKRFTMAAVAALFLLVPPEVSQAEIVSHPQGCPKVRFCGCGVSVKVFGHPVRDLFLASNWRKFPAAMASAGMVAYRSGHVMYIEAMDANGNAVVYDPNSGGHRTRIHTRSLAGYRIVNPHSYAGASPVNRKHGARHVTASLAYQERNWAY